MESTTGTGFVQCLDLEGRKIARPTAVLADKTTSTEGDYYRRSMSDTKNINSQVHGQCHHQLPLL